MQKRIALNSVPESFDCLYVDNSPVGSYGVFTSEDLPELVCIEIAKAIIFPKEILYNSYALTMQNGFLGFSPKDLVIDQYIIGWDESKVCIPLGNVCMYNHSDIPNCEFIQLKDTSSVGIVTIKAVKTGEELTVSYGPTWFRSKSYIEKVTI